MKVPTAIKTSISVNASERISRNQSSRSQKTADQKITETENQQQKIKKEIKITRSSTNSINGSGLVTSELRDIEFDKNILSNKEKVIQNNLLEIKNDAKAKTDKTSRLSVTPSQIEKEAKSRTVENKRNKQDTLRSLQKNQKKCNHNYDTTERCMYCSKKRTSHLYDTFENSILNQ